MYSPQVLDHFENPRNAGVMDSPDASVQCENPACGDVIRLTAKMSEGRLYLRFQAKGCVPSIACGSALTELASGRTVAELSAISREQLVAALGGLPEASTHASHLAMDVLAALLQKLGLPEGLAAQIRVPSGQ